MDLLIFLVQYIILQLKKETLLYKMERKTILLCIAGRKKKENFTPVMRTTRTLGTKIAPFGF